MVCSRGGQIGNQNAPKSAKQLTPEERRIKKAFQLLALRRAQRFDQASADIRLDFEATPEGIVKFSQNVIDLVCANKLDVARASVINGYLQTGRSTDLRLEILHARKTIGRRALVFRGCVPLQSNYGAIFVVWVWSVLAGLLDEAPQSLDDCRFI